MKDLDQAAYDVIFRLYRAVVILARESNTAAHQRQAFAVRALRYEAMLANTRKERDYWQALALRYRERKRRGRKEAA